MTDESVLLCAELKVQRSLLSIDLSKGRKLGGLFLLFFISAYKSGLFLGFLLSFCESHCLLNTKTAATAAAAPAPTAIKTIVIVVSGSCGLGVCVG